MEKHQLMDTVCMSFNQNILHSSILQHLGCHSSSFSSSFFFHSLDVTKDLFVCVISFKLCSDAMRLILVKPTNATRRLDSTGEVFHDGDHEHCTSGGPSPLTKSPEGMCKQYSGTSVEASFPPQETSLCCVSSPTHERSNGISLPRVSAQMSPLKTRNLTLSRMSDQDCLLLCGQVSGNGDDSTSLERAGNCVVHPNPNDGCGCSCPDAQQHTDASGFHQQSKQGTVQHCLSRVSNRKSLSSSPHIQPFSQSTKAPNTYQVLPEPKRQRGLLKSATNHPQNDLLQCRDQEGQKELLQQQPCNHFKLKESSQATFNIPPNRVECAETNQKLYQRPQPVVTADFNWRELFGKEPLLVQQRRKEETRCSVRGDPICKSSGDPAIVLNCRHLPYNPLTTTRKKLSTPASGKSVQSFSISHCSSLENQDLVEDLTRRQQSKVRTFFFKCCCNFVKWQHYN